MTSIIGGLPVAGAAASLFDGANAKRTSEDPRTEAAQNDPDLHARQHQGPAGDSAHRVHAATEADRAVMQNAMQAESAFLTQQIAQEGESAADDTPEADAGLAQRPDPVQVFLDYMAKTPEERYFDSFLKSKGLTEEAFEALPAEEKQALMREFEELVKTSIEKQAAENPAEPQAPGVM